MFDLSIWEIAIVVVVAILVVGPRELPRALATAGKWLRKFRSISNSLRSGLDDIIRETEMEEMEGKWAQQNKQIMAEYQNEMHPFVSDDMENDTTSENDLDISNTVGTTEDGTEVSIQKIKTHSANGSKAKKTKVLRTNNAKASKAKKAKASKPKNIKAEKAKGDQ